jgi:hypothetical protein
MYVGSAQNAASRLGSYWTPSQLERNRPLENNLRKYGHHNFAVAILEIIGPSTTSRVIVIEREQHYLDLLFGNYNSAVVIIYHQLLGAQQDTNIMNNLK